MNKLITHILLLLIFFTSNSLSQNSCFPKKIDHKFVYDIADVLNPSQENQLNEKLKAFTKNTSNVLVIVIPQTLCDYEKAEYSYRMGEQWGVGRADLDNGVVMMVKPKEIDGKGEAFIAVGNGLQGVIPDAIAKRELIDKEMIPKFKQQDYFGGIDNATNVIIDLASGEYSYSDYLNKKNSYFPAILFIVIFILFVIIASYLNNNNDNWDDWEDYDSSGKRSGRTRRNRPFIIIGGGGSGWTGGSSGGFGGFGGGGFDGGGAGGSW